MQMVLYVTYLLVNFVFVILPVTIMEPIATSTTNVDFYL